MDRSVAMTIVGAGDTGEGLNAIESTAEALLCASSFTSNEETSRR
jgi:hypothetical protein